MPTPQEIQALVGDKPTEQPGAAPTEEVVSADKYREVAQKYDNILKLETRHDSELVELRKKVKAFEQGAVKPVATETGDEDEDAALREKLTRLGFVPKGEVTEEVNKELNLKARALEIKSEVTNLVTKYPFAKESAIVDFLSKNPSMTTQQALQALYFEDLTKFIANGGTSIPETDKGGRTIAARTVPTEVRDAPMKDNHGIGQGRDSDLSGWLSRRIEQVEKHNAGQR